MKYNELTVSRHKNPTRVGRGIAAGKGKTAGRGTKGQKSRTGKGRRPGFEGGQNPLMQRLPKLRGFHSFKPKIETIYTGQLSIVGAAVVDNFSVAQARLISSPYVRVKLILKGEVTKKLQVKLQNASANAIAAVQKAGGTFESVSQVKRTKKSES